jgi:membrane-bound ClpP family serine protease
MKRCLVLLLGVALFLWGCGTPGVRSAAAEIYVARLDGQIDGRAAGYVERVISEAEEAEARAVVIKLDTPGGRLDHTQRIVESTSNAEGTPVITYVSPQGARAASAGTFIVMASDVAAMAPQTTIGAAAPVDVFGRDIPGILGEKVTNDAVALIRGARGGARSQRGVGGGCRPRGGLSERRRSTRDQGGRIRRAGPWDGP